MKNLVYILFLLLVFVSCKDEETELFEVSVNAERITFKPVPGGAIMYYDLKGHKDIFSIRATYTDVMGTKVVVDGSYLSDSLNLVGFNEARQGIPVYVSFFNHRLEESEIMELAFDTEDSAPISFFDHLEVMPGWNGFSVAYDSPETTGYAHIFYLGENPRTHEEDTILVQTVSIQKGRDTLSFVLEQERPMNTVIIRTEDFRGYRVKEKKWENVEAYIIEKFPSEQIELLDPCNIVITNDKMCMGVPYLFDGDAKPLKRFSASNPSDQYCVFVAGKNAVGQYWVMDLGEQHGIAKVRMFAPYSYGMWFGWQWKGSQINKLPCAVSLFGSNDQETWEKIGSFSQPYLQPGWGEEARASVMDYEQLDALQPVYADIACMPQAKEFRYVKFLVEDTFYDEKGIGSQWDDNPDGYVTLSELEVYVKK